MIRKHIKSVVLISGLFFSLNTYAQDSTAEFSTCLVDSLTGKERKELAKWIFMSIAVHPTIESYAKIEKSEREKTNKFMGSLVTKLLTDSCGAELTSAMKDNPLAIQQGFELVGKVAMQEIMTDETTMKALTEYSKYADLKAISEVTEQK